MKRKFLHRLLAIGMSICLSTSALALPVFATEAQTEQTTEYVTESSAETGVKTYKTKLTIGDKKTKIDSLKITQGKKDISYEYKDLSTDDKGVLYLNLPENKKDETTTVVVNKLTFTGSVKADGDNALKASVKSEKDTEKKGDEAVTEAPGTEKVTEETTEAISEPMTEELTEEITEPVTEEITEPVTEELTEGVTEEKTGGLLRQPNGGTEDQTDSNAANAIAMKPTATIDYLTNTIHVAAANGLKIQYSLDQAAFTDGQETMNIEDSWHGQSIILRTVNPNDENDFADSDPVTIPAILDAPQGIVASGVSQKGGTDGSISGITDKMEWKQGEGAWETGTGNKIDGLSEGTYQIRLKATDSAFASKITEVKVEVREEAKLEISNLNLNSIIYGETSDTTIKLKNSTAKEAKITKVGFKSATTAFTLNQTKGITVPGGKEDSTYKISTVKGLDAGEYSATFVVTYHNGTKEVTAEAKVSLKVNQKSITVNAAAKERAYDESKAVEVTSKGLEGAVSGDDVKLKSNIVSGTIADANAGNNKAVSGVKFELTGSDAANYKLEQPSGLKVNITKAENNKKPEKLEISKYTYDMIQVKAVEGQEYSIDAGENWSSQGLFNKDIEPSTEYRILTRYKETANYKTGSKELSVDQKTLRNPILAQAANNKITGIPTDANYKTNSKITFTASGDGMTNESPSLDDTRYVPTSWSAYTKGEWTKSPYSAEFIIDKAGTYTLRVVFTQERYDGSEWKTTTVTDNKTVQLKITSVSTGTTDRSNTTTINGKTVSSVKTGDETQIWPLILVLGGAALVIVALFVMKKKKKEE